jgi:hypothetical protein
MTDRSAKSVFFCIFSNSKDPRFLKEDFEKSFVRKISFWAFFNILKFQQKKLTRRMEIKKN